MMNSSWDNKYGKFWVDENQIFNFKYHHGVSIDLEAAQFLVKERIKLFNGNDYPFLVDITDLKYISNPASKYFASEEGAILVTAAVFLVNSFLSKLIGNYYLKIYPSLRPAKLFTNKEDAISWLKKYRKGASSEQEKENFTKSNSIQQE